MIRRATIALFALLVTAAAAATAMSGPDVLRRIRRAYDRTDSFQAEFDQTFIWRLAGSEQTMSGSFAMEKPNRFRVETEAQTVVTDGETVWSYSPATRQVILNDYDPATMPLRPDNFLLRFPDEDRVTYLGERPDGESTIHTIELIPSDSTMGIASMRVWVNDDDWFARKVTYVSVNADTTTYRLRNISRNPDLAESVFEFAIPRGVEVVDFRATGSR